MLEDRRRVATEVANQLFAVEAAIDAAVAAAATLTAMMPATRHEANLAATVGQDALIKAMETVTKLVEARSSIIATHQALSVVQKQIGLGAVAFGGLVDKSREGGRAGPQGRLLAAVDDTRRSA